MIIDYHKKFKKKYNKLPTKIKNKCDERIILFAKNQNSLILNKHSLHGDYSDCYSIDITGDIRAIYKIDNRGIVVFTDIGSHSDLYN